MGAGGGGPQACLAGAVPAEQLLKTGAHEEWVVGRIPNVGEEDGDGVKVSRCPR